MVQKPEIHTLIFTKNDCYTRYLKNIPRYTMAPKGIVVHSTGTNNPNLCRYVGPDDGVVGKNRYNNHWNQPGFKKCVHAFIGLLPTGKAAIYQCLPFDVKGWGVASGTKGSYNTTHIQFEMCEDGLTDETYWREVRALAVQFCAWLCHEYNIPVAHTVGSGICGHYEAHRDGYGNNHGDPRNWMSKFGDSMDLFREDVQAVLDGKPYDKDDAYGEAVTMEHYYGTVKTRSAGYVSIWKDAKKSKSLCKVKDGETVEVLGVNALGTMAPATANGVAGFVDTQYLTNIVEIAPQEAPEETDEPVTDTPDGILIPTAGLSGEAVSALLAALREAMLVGNDDEDDSDE